MPIVYDVPTGTARWEFKGRSREGVESSWLVENERLQSFTPFAVGGLYRTLTLCKPQAMKVIQSLFPSSPVRLSMSAKPISVNPRAPLRRRAIIFRQTNPARLSLAAKSVSVTPCACACPSPRSPFSVRLLVCRCEAHFRLLPCAFPSPQSLGPVPHTR